MSTKLSTQKYVVKDKQFNTYLISIVNSTNNVHGWSFDDPGYLKVKIKNNFKLIYFL